MIEIDQSYTQEFSFTQEDVIAFAKITGDNNPVHLDAEYAAQTMFKKPIMHGMLSASIFSRVFGTSFPGEGTIYLKQSLEFLRPMYVGEMYEAKFIVKEINKEKHTAVITTQAIEKSTGKVTIQGEAVLMHKERI